METAVLAALQAAHLGLAAFWLGSLLFTELVLWPRLRQVGALAEVQAKVRGPMLRRWMAVAVVGTVLTGLARGGMGGALDRVGSPYGLLYVLSGLVGTWMMVWWACSPPKLMAVGWRLWYVSFAVIFVLMVALRFVHP